jgi:hypothetical protein
MSFEGSWPWPTTTRFESALAENHVTCCSPLLLLWDAQLDSLNQDLPDQRKRINRDRKKFLTEREFTISVISNMLELFGVLKNDLFRDIDEIRRYRNEIVMVTSSRVGPGRPNSR